MNALILLALALLLVGLLLLAWEVQGLRRAAYPPEAVGKDLGEIRGQLGLVANNLQTLQQFREDLSRGFGAITEQVRRIEEAASHMVSLKEVLQSPTRRGGFGERLLEGILSDLIPPGYWEKQYVLDPLKGSRVDFVVKLDGRIVPIDSKFPGKASEGEIKRHIEAVSRYIQPDRGTCELALMYIPSESLYYEAFVEREDLYRWALERGVVPVSPRTLYVYLLTVSYGLKGLSIEKKAAEVRRELGGLAKAFEGLERPLQTLGRHLKDAQGSFSALEGEYGRLKVKVQGMRGGDDANET